MNETALLQNYQIVGALLVGIGLAGFLVRRNLILIFLCVEMMLQGISLSLVAWGRYHDNWDGQILVLFVITIAAAEAAVDLGIVISLFRNKETVNVDEIDLLKW